ncbi:MAG: hypothetical protein PHS57_10835 [Alphaproteobacteria bacterium]|nr:hypothetical protein [Alphaproteobacteria bacterium]
MIQIGAVATEHTNLTTRSLEDIEAASRNPYARGISAGEGVQTVAMTFDDVLDMLNPLEHIPGVSTLYRAAEGETIHPVARIVGDALYGGILGIASAGISAAGAVGDEILTAVNEGQSTASSVLAALTGDEAAEPTQVAQNNTLPATGGSLAGEMLAAALQAQEGAHTENVHLGLLARSLAEEKAKTPTGGILDSSIVSNGSGSSGTSGLPLASVLNGSHDTVAALPKAGLKGSSATAEKNLSLREKLQNEAAMQNVLAELKAGKRLDQYRATALATRPSISDEGIN